MPYETRMLRASFEAAASGHHARGYGCHPAQVREPRLKPRLIGVPAKSCLAAIVNLENAACFASCQRPSGAFTACFVAQ